MVVFAGDRPKLREGLTRDLAAWVYKLKFDDLSPRVIEDVKWLYLDIITQALAGSTGRGVGETGFSGVAPVLEVVKLNPGVATVIGTPITASPQFAALANGTFAHALNIMDTHRYSVPTHIGPSVYPTAFAVSQMGKTDFKTFATGVTAGFEITAKLAMAMQPGQGAVETVVANGLGCAALAAKMLGMDQDQIADSLGVAAFLTSGSPVGLELPSPGYWCRPMLSGWHSHNGIIAALLVREGLGGSRRILEAPYGFLNAFSVDPNEDILNSLGDPMEITRNSFKPYPCTRYMHAELDILLSLVNSNDIKPDSIEEIIIEKPRAMWEVTGTEERKRPPAPEVARLSSYYFAAVAVLHREVWLSSLEPEIFNASETWEMADKVRVVHNPDFDDDFPSAYTSRATLCLKDGRRISDEKKYPKGDPENPFSLDDLLIKVNGLYDYCFSDIISRERFDSVIERTMSLEREDDIGAFLRFVTPDA